MSVGLSRVVLIALALIPSVVVAQGFDDPPEIAGTVVEADFGEPLDGVTVSVEGTDLSAVTDENGRFSFSGLAAELVVLVVDEPGFDPLRVELDELDRHQLIELLL